MSWLQGDFADIPEDVRARISSEKVVEVLQERRAKVQGLDVFYRELPGSKQPSVLLLHGMSFSSATWLQIGTLDLLYSVGHRAVAVDLPGKGNTPSGSPDMDRGRFLADFIAAAGLDKPVIVSPSMSGSYSLPYLFSGGGGTEKATAYIPVAPVGTGSIPKASYQSCHLPTLIVYGSRDDGLGQASLRDLSQLPVHRVECFQDAGHACYMNRPDLWHRALYNVLGRLDTGKQT